jgi:TM2 domain-containing membrane protein YozV
MALPDQQEKILRLENKMSPDNNQHQDRILVSYILSAALFLGLGGLHRLYNGKIGTGILWLLTGGMFGIGQFVDLLLIPNMVDDYEQNLRAKAGLSSLGVPVNQPAIASQVYQPTGKQLMLELLRVAQTKGGSLTVTQGVIATGGDFAEVEETLKEMLKSGYVRIGNDPVTGAVTYYFDELG